MEWEKRFSKRSQHWSTSQLRGFFPLESTPGIVSALGGKPHPDSVPLSGLTLDIKAFDGSDKPVAVRLGQAELYEAFQYTATAGIPSLVKWLTEWQGRVHNRSDADWSLAMGAGTAALINNTFLALTDPGDSIIVPSPSWAFAEGYLRTIELVAEGAEPRDAAHHLRVVEPQTDGQGLDPADLKRILEAWPVSQRPLPKLLYLIPTASNPNGETIPEERRIEILRICKHFSIPIIEDDAYFNTWFSASPRPRSFFELEKEVNGSGGLVLRMDSASKVLGGGLRLAWISAPQPVVDKVTLITSNTTLQVPSTTQVMVYALLAHWGHDGFEKHIQRIARLYKARRDMAVRAAEEILGDVATWVVPEAGFFLYLKLQVGDSFNLVRSDVFKAGFLAPPGVAFMGPGQSTCYVRISYSLLEEEQLREGFKRLRSVCPPVRV